MEGEIHIGNMVKAELNRQDLSISWLARQVCCDASNLSKTLRKPSIHTDLLIRISNVLRHNFFDEVAELISL
ncbi:MAG: XRE family transcriptional regulator [Bacteroidales bacterium]|nr:XRE family transcriptional regulator [Bacteroidales bacterium]